MVLRKQRPRTGKRLTPSPKRIKKSLLKKCDDAFSLLVRARDQHCQFPGCTSTKKLQNSHYIGRAVKSTRFDPDNCVALCWFHHYKSKDLGFEYQKQTLEKHGFEGQYTIFMKNRLGPEKYQQLITNSKKKVTLTKPRLESLLASLKK